MQLGKQVYGARERHGFAYPVVLAMVALTGVGLAAIGPIWDMESKRQREEDLLRVGRLYANAIASYYKVSPGTPKRYPRELNDLLQDTRFVGTVRHLRQLYPDPIGGTGDWGLVHDAEGGIRGVYSQSKAATLQTTSVDLGSVRLSPATRYSDWLFEARLD